MQAYHIHVDSKHNVWGNLGPTTSRQIRPVEREVDEFEMGARQRKPPHLVYERNGTTQVVLRPTDTRCRPDAAQRSRRRGGEGGRRAEHRPAVTEADIAPLPACGRGYAFNKLGWVRGKGKPSAILFLKLKMPSPQAGGEAH
jgi:hypothetical protein